MTFEAVLEQLRQLRADIYRHLARPDQHLSSIVQGYALTPVTNWLGTEFDIDALNLDATSMLILSGARVYYSPAHFTTAETGGNTRVTLAGTVKFFRAGDVVPATSADEPILWFGRLTA